MINNGLRINRILLVSISTPPSAAAELQAEDRGPVEAVQGAGGDRGGEQASGQTAARASAGRVVPGAG